LIQADFYRLGTTIRDPEVLADCHPCGHDGESKVERKIKISPQSLVFLEVLVIGIRVRD